jgi:hypothetical protein
VVPKTTPRQSKTTGRVMHEFKHGELRSGPEGKGGKVKSRRQAIAIALSEAGASKYQSERETKGASREPRPRKSAARPVNRSRRGNRMLAQANHLGAAGLPVHATAPRPRSVRLVAAGRTDRKVRYSFVGVTSAPAAFTE